MSKPMQNAEPESVSIVLPVYNEEDNIVLLYEEIAAVLDQLGREAEIIFIDDGSADKSVPIMRELQESDPRVKLIVLRRNFGQTAAMSAGFRAARGDIIIAMDADLQNDPADIPRLLEKHDEGYDVISGWRKDRKDKLISRKIPSWIANAMISRVTGVRLHDYGCALKLYRREVLDELHLYGEMHRFIPALASWVGATITEMVVNHRPRRFGKSKYGISRTIRVILDLLTVKVLLHYATKPLHIFGRWGLLTGVAGFLLAAYLSVEKLFLGASLADRPALMLAILLMLGGLQLITMGVLAELQVRVMHETRDTPGYVIREVLGTGLARDESERSDAA